MPRLLSFWLLTFHISLVATLPLKIDTGFDQLIDQVHFLAKTLRQKATVNTVEPLHNTDHANLQVHKATHVPGWTNNICVNLCPKWCEKSTGNHTLYTNCHYVCGNLCHKQTRDANPFLGNQAFEVVPSSFQFAKYDRNHDKLLSMGEISRVEHVPPEDIRHLFHFADFNMDGHIDQNEFQGGPLVFTVQMAAELSAVAKTASVKDEDEDD